MHEYAYINCYKLYHALVMETKPDIASTQPGTNLIIERPLCTIKILSTCFV
jgi:hypothetical protein